MIRSVIIFLFSALIFACTKPHKTFVINCCSDSTDGNNINRIAESAGKSLQALNDTISLKKYLGSDEFAHAFDTTIIPGRHTANLYKHEYFPLDTIFTSHHFLAQLFFIKDHTQQKGYYFQIRTFNEAHSLVSVQDFATWSDREKKYCSGHLSKIDHSFTISCEHHEEHYEFDPHGKIMRIK